MKNIKIYLLAFASSLLIVSCNDAIDIVQRGELYPETAFETVDDLQLGLNTVYSFARDERAILFTSLFTDEAAVGVANGGQGLGGELSYVLNVNTPDVASIWRGYYQIIANANRIIEAAATIEPLEGEEEAYNDILGQAHALRAYGHLQLMTYFCTDMKNDASLGVIALDRVVGTDVYLPRNTAGEVYTLINADLDFAEANLPVPTSLNVRNIISRNFVTAFRARLAAYRGQYPAARAYAESLIGTASGTYRLTIRAQYLNIWNDVPPTNVNNSEVIFKFERTNNNANFAQYWASLNSGVSGSAFYEVGRALFNLVNFNSDIRRFAIVDQSAVIDPNYATSSNYLNSDILPVGKYPGSENVQLMNDVKVFRVSELYFIIAEAQAQEGDYAGVGATINAVRRVRNNTSASGTVGLNPIPTTATEAWAMILDERRIELAFEGHRYIDLKRLGVLANKGIDRDPKDCEIVNACTPPLTTDHRFTLPIPRSETTVNPNIQQNPGY